MEGYETIQSEGFTVSPPKLDLNFNLISTENPNVSDTVLTDGSIELTFSNYVKIDTVNNDSVHVDGTKNPYEIIPVKDSETDEVAKKFIIKGNFTDTLELTITVDNTVMGYNDLPVGAFSTKIENTGIIPVPAAVTNLVYNGMELTGVPDGSGYTVSGGATRDAGKYTAVLKLNEGLKWLGGSAEDAEIDWSIAEAEPSDVSVKQKAPLTYTGSELTAKVETTGQTVDGSKISFEYSTEKDREYSNKVSAFVQAGKYTVYYKAMAKNHVEVTGTFKVTVKKPIVTTVVTTTTKATTITTSKPTTVTTKATTVTTTTTSKPTTVTTKATTVSTALSTTTSVSATTVTTTTPSVTTPQITFVSGDANLDGKADVRDAAAIARFLAKKH